MPLNFRAVLTGLLLYGLFCAVQQRTAHLVVTNPELTHQPAGARPLLADSITQEFVRQLIAQADSAYPRAPAQPLAAKTASVGFRISRVLFEHLPVSATLPGLRDAEVRYRYGKESAGMLGRLCAEQILSAADTAFMRQQILRSTGFRLDPRKLPGCTIIPIDTLKRLARVAENGLSEAVRQLRSKYRTDAISYVSAPLFSFDMRYAVITVVFSEAADCGAGNTFRLVMEQRQGKWRPRRVIEE